MKSADGSKLCTNMKDIIEHWKEYFCNPINQQGTADPSACGRYSTGPIREELCGPITMMELDLTLKFTRSGKAPQQDGIPSDVLKQGSPTLKSKLLDLYNACWQTQHLPQDSKDALIVTIYKKKDDLSECGNHRGISFLSVAGKIIAKILLNRLKIISEEVLPESQHGFRVARATTDMIFTLRQLQEKAAKQQQPLYVVFVDISKAFEMVGREKLWELL